MVYMRSEDNNIWLVAWLTVFVYCIVLPNANIIVLGLYTIVFCQSLIVHLSDRVVTTLWSSECVVREYVYMYIGTYT